MAGYVYKGTVHDVKPKPGPVPPPPSQEHCGTPKGIWRHRYNQEPLCEPCRDKSNEQRRAHWHENKTQPRKFMRLATIEKLKQAEQLFQDGASQSEVQRKTGLGRMTIRQYFPGQGWTKSQGGHASAALRASAQMANILAQEQEN